LPDFDLAELGWNAGLAEQLEPGLTPGRVTAAHRAAYDVQTADDVVRTRLPGRMLHENADVAVGDWIGLGDGLIRSILPRHSALVRNAAGRATSAQTLASNVDVAFIVSSLGPDLEPRRIERYLVTIWESGATPEVVLTKADRIEDPWPMVAEVESVALGVPVHVVSAITGQGMEAFRARIQPGTTAVLIGSSGVGKSTIVNAFVGYEQMAVKEVRADDDEGQHMTSHRELILLPGGGVVIDTPGIRELQLWDASEGGMGEAFSDVEELAAECKFNDCTHTSEPGCAVLAAVESGTLARDRLQSWFKLQRELRAIAIRHDHLLRKQERRKWKLIGQDSKTRTRHR
jgi:ribosome biogenesis GTPase / thiamine phosphate phosphatase